MPKAIAFNAWSPDRSWSNVLFLSERTTSKADTKVVGDVTHILLESRASSLVSVEYDSASNTYRPWSMRESATPVVARETGTIDIDSTGRMWLATESTTALEVYHSDFPYASFSGPIILDDAITEDDVRQIARRLIEDALNGSHQAAREVLDRTLGRPEPLDLVQRLEDLEELLQRSSRSEGAST